MTDAIDAEVPMTKSDLFTVVRRHHEFVGASVILFAYGETRYLTNSDGHWLLFAIDFSCDTVFAYDSCNRFKGADEAFKKLIKVFIAPHLCYLQQHPGPLDNPEKGKVKDFDDLILRASNFKLNTIRMLKSQKDFFSCGFWATEMMMQIIMEKKPLAQVSVTTNVTDSRKFMLRLM